MNLKDITLGQFFPGNSFLHRLDPRMKLLGLICYLVALFLANWFVTYGVMLALLVLGCAVAHIRPKTLLGGLKPVIVLLVFTGVLNMFYTPGTPLVSFWIFTITYEGILHAFFMVVRIMMLICATFLLTYTTSPLALTDALESLLSPLNLIRVPVHELAMIMSIALRFIPTLIEETDKIMSAQRARGADFDSGGLIRKAKALLPLLVPLFISALRRAEELATAMECRCYCGGQGRTRLRELRLRPSDWVFLVCMVVLAVAMGLLGGRGL